MYFKKGMLISTGTVKTSYLRFCSTMISCITLCPRVLSRFGCLLVGFTLVMLPCRSDGEILGNTDKVQRLSPLTLKKYNRNSNTNTANDLQGELKALLRHLPLKHYEESPRVNCSSLSEVGLSALSDLLCQDVVDTCLSGEQIQHISNSTKAATDTIARLCPIILFHNSNSIEQDIPHKTSGKPTSGAVWGYGILFVTIISCCSLVGVVLLPLLNKTVYQITLMLFEGLAVGSLTGSAIFHLIPQSFYLVGQDAEHNYLWKSLIIFGGIYLFYLSERLMKIVIDLKKRKKKTEKNDNTSRIYNSLAGLSSATESSNSIAVSPQDKDNSHSIVNMIPQRTPLIDSHGYTAMVNGNGPPNLNCQTPTDTEVPHSRHHEHSVTFEKGQSTISTVAWMIIFGDGLHNFIDGLSIGAAFSESVLAGISISVAVVCEEFPHELGDFAVLLSAGMTMRQALMYNFLSACTCYLGLVFGVLLGDLAEGSSYIFALAGGMFLYIALVDMMGELGEALEEANQESASKALKIFLIQNIGIIIGVALLFLMARYSELINFENLGDKGEETESSSSFKALYRGLYDEQHMGYA